MDNDFFDEGEAALGRPGYFPQMTDLARRLGRRKLIVLAELSFIAGRAGDELSDWEADTAAAIAESYGPLRPDRRFLIKARLKQAFDAGVVHHWVDRAEVPRGAMKLARAYATVHEADIRFDCERLPSSNHSAAALIAYKVACRQPVDAFAAAKAALEALAEHGLRCLPGRVAEVLNSGGTGERERAVRHEILGRENAATAAVLDSIFDEEAGQ